MRGALAADGQISGVSVHQRLQRPPSLGFHRAILSESFVGRSVLLARAFHFGVNTEASRGRSQILLAWHERRTSWFTVFEAMRSRGEPLNRESLVFIRSTDVPAAPDPPSRTTLSIAPRWRAAIPMARLVWARVVGVRHRSTRMRASRAPFSARCGIGSRRIDVVRECPAAAPRCAGGVRQVSGTLPRRPSIGRDCP